MGRMLRLTPRSKRGQQNVDEEETIFKMAAVLEDLKPLCTTKRLLEFVT